MKFQKDGEGKSHNRVKKWGASSSNRQNGKQWLQMIHSRTLLHCIIG